MPWKIDISPFICVLALNLNTNKIHDTCNNAQERAKTVKYCFQRNTTQREWEFFEAKHICYWTRMLDIAYNTEFDILKWKCHKIISLLSKHAKGIKFNFMQWFDRTQT